MLHVFLDTNVILDYLLNRQPLSLEAAKILTFSEQKKLKVYVSVLTIANSYYLMRKNLSHARTIINLETLCEFTDLLDLKKSSILSAFKSGFSDFEDAIQHEIAFSENRIKIIITRNIKDFKKSKLEVLSPEIFLKMFLSDQINF